MIDFGRLRMIKAEFDSIRVKLLKKPGRSASQVLFRDADRDKTDFLACRCKMSSSIITGESFAPLADWLLIVAPAADEPTTFEYWQQKASPRFAQLLTLILVGLGKDRTEWRGWAAERGEVVPVREIELIGAGMPILVGNSARSAQSSLLARMSQISEELQPRPKAIPPNRSRIEAAIPPELCDRIKGSQIGIVGASYMGHSIATYLAGLGAKGIVLMDNRKVSDHHVGPLPLTMEDIAKPLAGAISEQLAKRFPNTNFYAPDTANTPKYGILRDLGSEFGSLNLWVTCVDTDFPRLAIAEHCTTKLIPHLDVEYFVSEGYKALGRVRLVLPYDGCIVCAGGIRDMDQALYELNAPVGALPRRPPLPWNSHGRIGTLPYQSDLIASAAVQTWLGLLKGEISESVDQVLQWERGSLPSLVTRNIPSSSSCDVCGKK